MATETAAGTIELPALTTDGAGAAYAKSGISITDVKRHLKLSENAAINDDYLLMLLNAALSWVEEYCGFRFGEASVSEYVTPSSATATLRVKRLPIVSVSSIVDAWDDTTEDSTDYRVNNARTGIDVVEDFTWETDQDQYLITYTGGYGGTYPVPHGVKVAVITLVARWYEMRDTAKFVSHEGQVSKSYFDFHSSDIIRILDNYRLGALVHFA